MKYAPKKVFILEKGNYKEITYSELKQLEQADKSYMDKFFLPLHGMLLQAMYLDKPMKDHTLLQAICRTNRVYGQDKTYGLIVDYIGIFDDVAKALAFDAEAVEKIITNIDSVKGKVPLLVAECVNFFPGVDRTRDDWEGLVAAQECLPTDTVKDNFGAHYRVLNRVWNALSPDACLNPYKQEYKWLSKVYDSIRPTDERGKLIWAALGPKTLQLVHENISVEEVVKTEDVISMGSDIIEHFIAGDPNAEKKRRKIEIDLAAIIRSHPDDPRFIALGERMEKLREEHEAGLLTSMEFLKALLELAKDAAQMEREIVPEDQEDKGKAALTSLFQTVRNDNTPVIVERIVNDIDGIVKESASEMLEGTAQTRQEQQLQSHTDRHADNEQPAGLLQPVQVPRREHIRRQFLQLPKQVRHYRRIPESPDCRVQTSRRTRGKGAPNCV